MGCLARVESTYVEEREQMMQYRDLKKGSQNVTVMVSSQCPVNTAILSGNMSPGFAYLLLLLHLPNLMNFRRCSISHEIQQTRPHLEH
jgi:hypothetical protein